MLYTVGEIAKILGIPASTLRYYDKEGLLPFVNHLRLSLKNRSIFSKGITSIRS